MQDDREVSEHMSKFLAFMNSAGLNVTAQRQVIAKAFFEYPGHHSLEELYHHIQTIDRTIGQTTVYRTLKLLCEAGLAMEIHFTDGVARYEIVQVGSHHDHIMCMGCGKIVEIYDKRIEALQSEIAREHGFKLLGHYHVLYGICPDCAREGKPALSGAFPV